MKQSDVTQALACLDASFRATFTGTDLERMFSTEALSFAIGRGVLVDAGLADSLRECACELHEASCNAPVEQDDEGRYQARCLLWGSPIAIPKERLQRYRFEWRAWARELRRANKLDGPEPTLGQGCLLVGTGSASGSRYELVIAAPGRRQSGALQLPRQAGIQGTPVIVVATGSGPLGKFEHVALDATDVLEPDLITLRMEPLEDALAGSTIVIADARLTHRAFTQADSKGRLVNEADAGTLLRRALRDKFDVVIDLVQNKAWHRGRPTIMELDARGTSTGKRLGAVSLQLLADYLKHPDRTMAAHETATYRQRSVEPRTASTRLAAVCRSLACRDLVRHVAQGDAPGEGRYRLEPGDATYLVIERAPRR